jgi:uncharacterized protein (TIGR03435 family)
MTLSRVVLIITAIGCAVIPLLSQTTAEQKPSFEVASIKPNDAGPGAMMIFACNGSDTGRSAAGPLEIPKGRCILINASLRSVIAYAFGIPLAQKDQVSGGPGWLDSDRFDINAKAEDTLHTTQTELKGMLQTLLQDRCNLAIHRGSKELVGYELVVANGGSKLRRSDSNDEPPDLRGGKGSITGKNVPLARLAGALGLVLSASVRDKTNLAGGFDFDVNWEAQNDLNPGGTGGPSLFTALQEQLGLRLVSAKVPDDVIIIDSVQKPTAN